MLSDPYFSSVELSQLLFLLVSPSFVPGGRRAAANISSVTYMRVFNGENDYPVILDKLVRVGEVHEALDATTTRQIVERIFSTPPGNPNVVNGHQNTASLPPSVLYCIDQVVKFHPSPKSRRAC